MISIARSYDDPVCILALLLLSTSDPSAEETTRDTSLSWTKLLLGLCWKDFLFFCNSVWLNQSHFSPQFEPIYLLAPVLYHCSSLFDNKQDRSHIQIKSGFLISCAGLNFFSSWFLYAFFSSKINFTSTTEIPAVRAWVKWQGCERKMGGNTLYFTFKYLWLISVPREVPREEGLWLQKISLTRPDTTSFVFSCFLIVLLYFPQLYLPTSI